jgi:hypothetical protein
VRRHTSALAAKSSLVLENEELVAKSNGLREDTEKVQSG